MMFNLKLDEPRLLNNSISVISEFITEANFIIDKEAIKLVAMDPANISMVVLKLLPSAFTEYTVEEPQDITVNLEALRNSLKRAKSTDSLTLSLDKNKLKIIISGKSTKRFLIPLLERESREKKIPALEFSAVAELDAKELQEYIEDVSIAGEAVTMEATPELFALHAGETGSKVNIEVAKGADALLELTATDKVSAIYSLEYLKKMAKASALADTVRVQFSNDYPLRLDFKAIDKMQLSFILAPRIENK